jgi:tetratricopeptide (TPR) repeat protein
MTDRELAFAARHALVNLDNARELLSSPLFPRDHTLSYETVRFVILSALESLEVDEACEAQEKQRRRHAILVRCDLKGATHKSVLVDMAISRRQFYRERHEALLRLASSIQQLAAKAMESHTARATSLLVDLEDAAQAYIEALRAAGQHPVVVREAGALARRVTGDTRETECLLIASESARFCGDDKSARDMLGAARLALREPSSWCTLWIAGGSMSVQWVAGESDDARAIYERTSRATEEEATMHGKEAVLLAIILVNAARMEADCGRWERARSLLARASRLAQNGVGTKAQSLHRLSVSLSRLSALLALHADGNVARSISGYRTALEGAKLTGELGFTAETAVQYAVALADTDVTAALLYADYGLGIVRRYFPGDRLGESTLDVTPLLLKTRGTEAARGAIERARFPGLGVRDSLFLELAEAKVASHQGKFADVAERAHAVAENFFAHGINAWACDAELLAIEAYSALGMESEAKSRFVQLADAMVCARAGVRARAEHVAYALLGNDEPALPAV